MCRTDEDVISLYFIGFLEEKPFMAFINKYNENICLQAARTHPSNPNRLTLKRNLFDSVMKQFQR